MTLAGSTFWAYLKRTFLGLSQTHRGNWLRGGGCRLCTVAILSFAVLTLLPFLAGDGVRQSMPRRSRRITQIFPPVDLPLPGFGSKLRIFQRFLCVFRFRFNLLWIEWFRFRSRHRFYPRLCDHEEMNSKMTSTLCVTLFSDIILAQSRARDKPLQSTGGCEVWPWRIFRSHPACF